MTNLIKLSAAAVGGQQVETVNARELHAYLENGDHFSTWIKERIEQYGFIENQDFVTFSAAAEKGRPRVEYAVTIDMAKELSMVERNAKGKEARQYFIECERRAKSGVTTNLPAMREAVNLFQPFFEVATLIGCDKQAAAISANQAVLAVSGANVLRLMGRTHMEAENQEAMYFTPTELGKRIGTSARGMNLLLAEAGFQMKRGEHWEVTDAGKDFARIYDTGKKHGSGVPIQQIKWSPEVIPAIGKDAA